MSAVAVLDYGAGNLKNVCRALKHLGAEYLLVTNPADLDKFSKLIIPGVGAFKVAMDQLHEQGMVEPLREFARSGKQVMGICLGMQMLFETSHENGETEGLGLLDGTVERIPELGTNGNKHKVPHIGWNEISPQTPSTYQGLLERENNPPVYFVHSYMANLKSDSDLIASCQYDGVVIPAIVGHSNILGCQFHPEKSGRIGLELLSLFLES